MNLFEPLSSRDRKIRTGELPREAWLESVDRHVRASDPFYKAFAEWRPVLSAPSANKANVLITYKDTIDVAGFATRLGSSDGYRHYPVRSAAIATALDERGFLCNGKVATTEFGLGTRTVCINPKFPNFSPSGSSTGSAVAVAAGFCDLSVGTDSSGSVRWPAGNCGLVGMRLTPCPELNVGVFGVSPGMDSIGLLTRSMHDLAYLWRHWDLTSLCSGRELPQYQGKRALKFGVVTNYEESECHPEIRTAFDGLVQKLSESGVEVLRKALGWWRFRSQAWSLLMREAYDLHCEFQRANEVKYEPGTADTIHMGRDINDREYESLKEDQRRAVDMAHKDLSEGDVDILLLPLDSQLPRDTRVTLPPPTSIPAKSSGREEEEYSKAADEGFAEIASFARIPALTLPMGVSVSGAPIAVQLMARQGGEDELILAGALLERIVDGC